MKIQCKLLDSMTKVLPSATLPPARPLHRGSALRGEYYAFQLAYKVDEEGVGNLPLAVSVESTLPVEAIRVRTEELMPARYLAPLFDNNVLTRELGLFPDLLRELNDGTAMASGRYWRALHVQVHIPEECPAGEYTVALKLANVQHELSAVAAFGLEVIPAQLPAQTIEHTEWFHCDCIAELHNVPVWSEPYWALLEKYFVNMTEHGITQVLTPILTPELDTAVGAERLTTQLLDITLDKDGEWSFGFERLKRWIELAKKCGLRRFEFSHLFTQWGAAFAPKVMAMTPEGEKRVFGWETDADDEKYRAFLKAMLKALTQFVDELGIAGQCCLHISDEPTLEHLEQYRRNMAFVREATGDKIIIFDALSHLAFMKPGENACPVTSIVHLPEFIEAGIKPLWTYYCCAPVVEMTNRFLHFPGARTRALGIQLFHYRVDGFLHWGYNFWHSSLSKKLIDPFNTADGDGDFPAGDPFLVYPGPQDSLRYEYMREAFQDHRALTLLASLIGQDKAEELLLALCGGTLSNTDFPMSSEALNNLRHAVNMKIKAALKHS